MSKPIAAARGDRQETAPVRRLDRRMKAAVVVRLLLNEGADIPLESLPEDLQALLTQKLGEIGLVDRDTLGAVADEFAQALDSIGLSGPRGIAGALEALDGRISAQTAARLRKEAGVREAGDPWARLRALSVDDLAGYAQRESVEIAAVLLSKLEVAKAAEVLGALPGPRARSIAHAVGQTGKVTPDAVDRIGLSLAAQLDARPLRAFEADPVERLGDLLNSSPAATREDVLVALDETDADLAGRVRRAIFTFGHIPARLAEADVPRVIREIEQAELLTALAAAEASGGENAAAASFMLGALSRRMAEGLREEMAERGAPRARDGERAMTAVVAVIRRLQAAGEISPVTADEDEEDAAA